MSHLCGSLKDLIAFTGEHDDYLSDSVALANLNRPCRLFGWMNMNDKSKLLLPNLLLHVCPICLFNNLFILFAYIHHITSLCICVNHVPSSPEFRLVWFPSRRRWPWPLKGLLRSLRRGLIQDHPATNGDHVYSMYVYIYYKYMMMIIIIIIYIIYIYVHISIYIYLFSMRTHYILLFSVKHRYVHCVGFPKRSFMSLQNLTNSLLTTLCVVSPQCQSSIPKSSNVMVAHVISCPSSDHTMCWDSHDHKLMSYYGRDAFHFCSEANLPDRQSFRSSAAAKQRQPEVE